MSAPLRVLVADDHVPTREEIAHALHEDGFAVVAQVGDGARAVAAAQQHRPDVCLLDIHMPGNGIAAAAEISRVLPQTPVVMLTASREDEDLFEALRAGASGYLLKDMDHARLGAALRGVLAGEAALPRWLVLRVVDQFREEPRGGGRFLHRRASSRLTSREQEILALMGEDLTTEQIAQRLFVAPVTVRTHISAILKKLHVPDRESAIRLAREASGG